MLGRIQKWGNSLALRIPKALAMDFNMKQGTPVEIVYGKNGLIITPAAEIKYSLQSLLNGIHKNNLHGEIDAGGAAGREEW